MPQYLILTHIKTPNSQKGLTSQKCPHLAQGMHTLVLTVQHVEGNSHGAAYLPISVCLPKILGPRRAQRGPRSPTNCHNQRLHGG